MAGRSINLGRDLLDTRLVDRHQQQMGRVDGVVLELRDGKPPRVAALEIGLLTAARRIHPALAAVLRRLVRRLPVRPPTLRLPLTLLRDVGVDIELDVDTAADRRLLRVEHWLSRHIVERLPHFKPGAK